MTDEQMEKVSAIIYAAESRFNSDLKNEGLLCDADFFDDEDFYVNVSALSPDMRKAASGAAYELNEEIDKALTESLGFEFGRSVFWWRSDGEETEVEDYRTVQYHYYE